MDPVSVVGVLTGVAAAEPDGDFHVLGGRGGVGKTTVAPAVAERAQNAGRPVWRIAATDVRP
ncbi:hypothetical protein ACNF49_40625 [Actinomadura sp. ATCC 39365]